MAGVSRLQYTTEIRLIRVMCSGRVDLDFILRAFANGVDGVFIGGCRLNECNYITHGNFHALNTVLLCRKLLEHVGLNPERLRVEFMSSSDGMRFTDTVDRFCKSVKALGPLSRDMQPDPDELKSKLEECRKLVPYIKRVKREKLETRLADETQYEDFFTRDEIAELISEVEVYYIDPQKCRACMICSKRCPVDAIDGAKNRIHVIDQDKCIKCGTCYEACPPRFGAVAKVAGRPAPPPIPEEERTLVKKSA